jgi:uncharacterized protein with HEPN domain
MRDPRERLRDMLEAIARIDQYTAQGQDAFAQSELIQTWVVHHLLIVGEASAAIPTDVRALAPNLPWRQIMGMRNILVHHYFDIDLPTVWAVVEHDLPMLAHEATALLAALDAAFGSSHP